ncbi:hypothetical protein FOXYSP1_11770 [Fusarium oxysporum f. sp. phaseoli]
MMLAFLAPLITAVHPHPRPSVLSSQRLR